MKMMHLTNGDFQFAPNQQATEWRGTAPNVTEIVTAKTVEAILFYLAEHQPVRLKEVLKLHEHY